jgi:hypothetical protein
MVFVKKFYLFFYLILLLTLSNSQNSSASLNLVKVNDATPSTVSSNSNTSTNSISQTSSGLSYTQPLYNPQIYQNPSTLPIYSNSGQIPYNPQIPIPIPNTSPTQDKSIC